ncbi:hypothetical protein CLV28_0581 [Sediminihabitans luteus]|uniref:CprB tetracyclin repressor-like C-terminal domain-containing protein n=1 Tax=Sediminihabitans luteus TaxID=1138585 RepID=A0A2M9CZJ4_9CELL|nr:hypothetical protein [Sediminihabitans luteus]PJJ77362.1 hypothetical protein CLV28_0581 [Sediminihabitans luteus]GII98255.1 hypothetical protein Slu03_06330 [Sediminihabitans luteus]
MSDHATDSAMQDRVLRAASTLLARSAFVEVRLDDVAAAACCDVEIVAHLHGDMHGVATAVLHAEGSLMRRAMIEPGPGIDPLDALIRTFVQVGCTMRDRVEVRAGMRLAAESHRHFPERSIDPFRTWETFVLARLHEARAAGRLSADVEVEHLAWTLVAAGMGTKDLVEFRDAWDEAPDRLGRVARVILSRAGDEAIAIHRSP